MIQWIISRDNAACGLQTYDGVQTRNKTTLLSLYNTILLAYISRTKDDTVLGVPLSLVSIRKLVEFIILDISNVYTCMYIQAVSCINKSRINVKLQFYLFRDSYFLYWDIWTKSKKASWNLTFSLDKPLRWNSHKSISTTIPCKLYNISKLIPNH